MERSFWVGGGGVLFVNDVSGQDLRMSHQDEAGEALGSLRHL